MAKKKKGLSFGGALLGGVVIGDSIGKKISKSLDKFARTEFKTNGKVVVHNKKKKKWF